MVTGANNYSGKNDPQGFGGWLLLPIIGLFVSAYIGVRLFIEGSLILFGPEIWSAFNTPGTQFYHSWWVPVIVLGASTQVGLVVGSVIALVTIFMKKRFVPRLMIGIYLLGFLLVAVDFLLVEFFLSAVSPDLAEQARPESFRKLIGVTVGVAIWIPYFLKSVRVKNTFVH